MSLNILRLDVDVFEQDLPQSADVLDQLIEEEEREWLDEVITILERDASNSRDLPHKVNSIKW